MSIKIYLDNNFFDEYDKCIDGNLKDSIKKAFKNKTLSFYPSLTLFEEMLRILETKRANLLENSRNLLFEFMPSRIFKYWGEIVTDELLRKNESIYLSGNKASSIKEKFRSVKTVEQIKKISNLVLEENKRHLDYYKTMQDKIRKKNILNKEYSFDEYSKEMDKQCHGFAERIFLNNGFRSDLAKQEALRISKNINNYPYFKYFFKIISALHFKYYVDDRKVDEGDYQDALQLVYMVGLDVLITNDKCLSYLCKLVFNGTKKVVAFNSIKTDLLLN